MTDSSWECFGISRVEEAPDDEEDKAVDDEEDDKEGDPGF